MWEGKSYDLRLYHTKKESHVFLRGDERIVSVDDYQTHMRKKSAGAGGGNDVIHGKAEMTAQMPGKVVGVKVKEGDEVALGQGLVVLEAMKMENEITAPKAGKVTKVAVTVGQSVESGALLVVVE
ncbi:biotin/lipoyl-binding protein [bacterium]|nr:biotin/lipoyl-binding protein [bacterium]